MNKEQYTFDDLLLDLKVKKKCGEKLTPIEKKTFTLINAWRERRRAANRERQRQYMKRLRNKAVN